MFDSKVHDRFHLDLELIHRLVQHEMKYLNANIFLLNGNHFTFFFHYSEIRNLLCRAFCMWISVPLEKNAILYDFESDDKCSKNSSILYCQLIIGGQLHNTV